MRLRRKPAPGVVAVTGAGAGVGRALVERLATRTDLDALVGLDLEPARVDGVVWRAVDLGDPGLAGRLHGVTTLVHLATPEPTLPPESRRGQAVAAARAVADAAAALGARLVLCTSSHVYGVRPDHPVPLHDGAPIHHEESETVLGDHLAVEEVVTAARRTGVDVTVLRPAPVVGLPPLYDAERLRQLASPRLLAVRGHEPLWQLCHLEDLVSALELAVLGLVSGSVGVACEGALPQAEVERISGRRRLELPAAMARSTAERLQRVAGTASPAELDHALGDLVLACDSLRKAGWAPLWTNEAALEAHLRARSGDGRALAYTAAGATVAVLGAAAIVRQARRRRRLS